MDISLSLAYAGRSVPLFPNNRHNINDALFIDGGNRQGFAAGLLLQSKCRAAFVRM